MAFNIPKPPPPPTPPPLPKPPALPKVEIPKPPAPPPLPKIEIPKPPPLPKIEIPKPPPLPKIEIPKPPPLPKIELPKPPPLPHVQLPRPPAFPGAPHLPPLPPVKHPPGPPVPGAPPAAGSPSDLVVVSVSPNPPRLGSEASLDIKLTDRGPSLNLGGKEFTLALKGSLGLKAKLTTRPGCPPQVLAEFSPKADLSIDRDAVAHRLFAALTPKEMLRWLPDLGSKVIEGYRTALEGAFVQLMRGFPGGGHPPGPGAPPSLPLPPPPKSPFGR